MIVWEVFTWEVGHSLHQHTNECYLLVFLVQKESIKNFPHYRYDPNILPCKWAVCLLKYDKKNQV